MRINMNRDDPFSKNRQEHATFFLVDNGILWFINSREKVKNK